MGRISVLAIAPGLLAVAAAQTQPPLNLVGSAELRGTALRLTPAERHMAGAAWLPEKQTVAAGFETSFEFQLSRQGGLGPGADGFAFVLQNSGPNALGGRGSAGGFALGEENRYGKGTGIPQSIAVFFDTFRNGEIGDPSDNYIAICTAGREKKVKWPPARLAYTKKLAVWLKDGRVHSAHIVYRPPILAIEVDGRQALVSTVDLRTVTDPEGAAYVGFTSSTGNGYENHDILNWSFQRTEVSSDAAIVSSNIAFLKAPCLPEKNLCTPERAVIEETAPGVYHVVLPANLDWGASVANASGHPVEINNARGTVCWNAAQGAAGCGGPSALLQKTDQGRTYFSIHDPTGDFKDNEGYLEFDAKVK
jgi:hypothetical protein